MIVIIKLLSNGLINTHIRYCTPDCMPVKSQTPFISTLSEGGDEWLLLLNLEDNSFRKSVYLLLCQTKFGDLITYGQIAKRLSSVKHLKNMSPQAIGNAVSRNSISIIIPCHRVVGSDGTLNGYSGGVFRKLALLKHEGHNAAEFVL